MSDFPMPSPPKITLDRVDYLSTYGFNPRIDAFQATGTDNVARCVDDFCSSLSTVRGNGDVAIDIETHGVTPDTRWQITCVTAAFWTTEGIKSVLLNPLREPEHRKIFRRIIDNSTRIALHNCFTGDTEFITRDGIRKLADVAGQTVEVWADGRWIPSPVRLYGNSAVQKVTVVPAGHRESVSHTFKATPNHRWELIDGSLVNTEDLSVGDKIRASRTEPVINLASAACVAGEKYGVWSDHLPENPTASEAADFVEGWQYASGTGGEGERHVKVYSEEASLWLRHHAALAGWQVLYFTDTEVTISRGDVEWEVVSVGEPSEPVPVYCVEVEGVERFTLAEGVYTANSPFDIPVLVAHQLLTLDDVNKVWDTLVLARMLDTISRGGRSLEDLSRKFRIVPDDGVKIQQVFSASGHASSVKGFANMDINSGTYRDGAMSDTVVTLKLLEVLNDIVVSKHTRDMGRGMLSFDGAQGLINDMQRINQITLRRAARGFRIDHEFPEKFHHETDRKFKEAADELILAGLEPGRGDKLIEHLSLQGALPDDWARTPGGKLSGDKKAMKRLESLGHPLATAHRTIAETTKVRNYLDKVVAHTAPTGRLHPTMSILGAAASGRMSLSDPELQQFPPNARGIILADDERGWSSVDWSSIEPVTMGVCAGDTDLLLPFYRGEDLYIPVSRAAGLIPPEVSDEDAAHHSGRKVAKVVVLAGMYGQGIRSLSEGLSAALKRPVDLDEAKALKFAVQNQMPASFEYMKNIERVAERTHAVTTISGRVLDEDVNYLYRAVNHFCITPDTTILTADLRHVRADSVKVGDELVGFDEFEKDDTDRSLQVATVKNVHVIPKPSVRVHTSDGKHTDCSTDHRWLVTEFGSDDAAWVSAEDLIPGTHTLLAVSVESDFHGVSVQDALEDRVLVDHMEYLGEVDVVAIETSTHTFIANGYLSHNCQGSAADILYQATLMADREGLSDYINLWMHDELICETSVHDEIVHVMQTPPEQLRYWSQIDEIVLRTDATPMGMAWKSV